MVISAQDLAEATGRVPARRRLSATPPPIINMLDLLLVATGQRFLLPGETLLVDFEDAAVFEFFQTSGRNLLKGCLVCTHSRCPN
jgi:hypothetical protein